MFIEKLKNLGATSLNDKSTETYSISKVISELNTPFPDEYLSLLKSFDSSIVFEHGAIFKPKQNSPVDNSDGFQSLEMLYGLKGGSNLIKKNEMYKDQIPKGHVVIGESIGGSQICVSRASGKVYFWFHEAEFESNSLFEIADNIDDFLTGIERDDVQTSGRREIDESGSFLDF